MKEIILAKFGELVLKGLNRRSFEAVIEKNTMRALEPIGKFSFFNVQSTIYIECEDDGPFADTLIASAKEIVRDIFGFVSVSTAAATEKDMDAIAKTAKEYLAPTLSAVKTFKVEAKRSDKRFPLKSPEICREIGGVLLSNFHHLKVDVHNPDVTVYVEIRDRVAYIHCGREQGTGGLPVGT
ncbi:MAG: tRNA 4-thiouridine(8) synthase ThiI, partial [Clostridia bacterium]|nr:tRNA 4-thiouridine(8) synthase ThiI [Clostridia bacterium]